MRTILCAFAATALLPAGAAIAQTAAKPAAPPPAAAAPAAEQIDPFEQAMAARAVADFARRQKDVHAMITAARMLNEVKFENAPADPNAAAPTPGAAPAAFTPEGLFAEATAMANNDRQLLIQIQLARSASRGVIASAFGKGLVRIVQAVAPNGAYAFPITAKAGELLRIGAIGDINTRMVVRLLDARGKVVCEDDSGDYAPVCSLRPGAAANYKVEVRNRSANATKAVILSN